MSVGMLGFRRSEVDVGWFSGTGVPMGSLVRVCLGSICFVVGTRWKRLGDCPIAFRTSTFCSIHHYILKRFDCKIVLFHLQHNINKKKNVSICSISCKSLTS